MSTMLTCFVLLRSRKERSTLLTLSLNICLLKITNLFPQSMLKSNSPLAIWLLPKKQNPEKQKPLKIRTQTKNVAIGLPIKINDTIGSLSYIINTSLTNISVELTGSLNRWLLLQKPERQSNADLIIKKWKKNTSISLKS